MGFPKPDKQPRWGTVATTDPTSAAPNVSEPPDTVKDTGFAPYLLRPPRQWVNWLLNRLYQWSSYLADQSKDGFAEFTSGAMAATGPALNAVTGQPLVTRVDAHASWLNGERADVAQADVTATDAAGGQRNYVYEDAADRAVKITLTAATAFAAGNLPLGVVITDGAGAISSRVSFPRRGPRDRHQIVVGARGDFRAGFGLNPLASAVEYARVLNAVGTLELAEIVVDDEVTATTTAGLLLDFPCIIRGASPVARVRWSHDGPVFRVAPGGDGSAFLDLTFEYTGLVTNASAAAVYSAASDTVDRVEIHRCTFMTGAGSTGLRRAVHRAGNGSGWKVLDCTFLFVTATPCRAAVELRNPGGTSVEDYVGRNRIRGNVTASAAGSESDAIIMDGAMCSADGNHVLGFDRGIDLGGEWSTARGNTLIDWCGGYAVHVRKVQANVSANTCRTTKVTALGGVLLDGAASQATVSGNSLVAVPSVPGGFGVLTTDAAQNGVACGNLIFGWGTAATPGGGIAARSQWVVDGNRVESCHGPAVRVGEAAISAVEAAVIGNVIVDSTAAGSYALCELYGGRHVVTGNAFKGMTATREAVRINNSGLENVIHDNLDDNTVHRLSETATTALTTRGARRRYADGETSGGVALLLLNTTLPTPEVVRLVAVVVARDSTGFEAATWRLEKSYRRDSGVVTALPGDTTSEHKTAGYTGAAPLITTAGAGAGAVVISISGIDLKVIRWSASLEIHRAREAFAS